MGSHSQDIGAVVHTQAKYSILHGAILQYYLYNIVKYSTLHYSTIQYIIEL